MGCSLIKLQGHTVSITEPIATIVSYRSAQFIYIDIERGSGSGYESIATADKERTN